MCLVSGERELVEHFRAPADRDGPYGLSRRVAVYEEPVRGVVEVKFSRRHQGHDIVAARVRKGQRSQAR
jgi:hypothetical protein